MGGRNINREVLIKNYRSIKNSLKYFWDVSAIAKKALEVPQVTIKEATTIRFSLKPI